MASHHHHHHHNHHSHRESIPLVSASYATSSRCCCGDSSLCCTQTQPNHTPPLSPDHLLRLIASYLQQQQENRCPDRTCSCETLSQRCNGIRRQSFVNQQKNVQREYDKLVLASLLRKIDDLDLSLNRFSASYDERRGSYCTLKDSAARVIQTYFRSYLVGRSQSLRQLKELATIKSSLLSLKSLVSGKAQFPIGAVSREATDLLLQLDSIQGKLDPMVRNGKRSLSKDLLRFLRYLEGCALRRHNFVSKSSKDAGFTGSCNKVKRQGSYAGEDRTTEKVRKQMGRIYVTSNGNEEDSAELEEFHFISDDGEEIPSVSVESRKVGSSKSRNGSLVKGNKVLAPVTKTVKLGKNGNTYQVHGNIHEPTSSTEDDDSVDDNKEILMMSRDDGVVNSSRTRSGSGVLIKDGGGKTRVMKTVSFDENGNIYRVYGDTPEASVSGGDESSTCVSNDEDENAEGDTYNEIEQIKYVPKENEGFKEDEEEDSSSEGSKERLRATRNDQVGRNDHKRQLQLQKGSLMFSPPLPLKMEP